jgi:hypothetical protein
MNELEVRPPSVHRIFVHAGVLVVVIEPDEDTEVEVEDVPTEVSVT